MVKTLGEFEQLLLFAIIRLSDRAYGVTIRTEIESRTGKVISSGAVYTALDRMERRHLVRSKIGDPTPQRGGRRKKFYSVTPVGARSLTESYENLRQMAAGLTPRLTQLAGQVSKRSG